MELKPVDKAIQKKTSYLNNPDVWHNFFLFSGLFFFENLGICLNVFFSFVGSTKIFLLSFFKLVSDVRPVFIIYDPKGKKIVQDREDLR
jgi:hypothetical protein